MPSTATARVRQLSRGSGRKNDRIDAAAAACVAFTQGDYRRVTAEEHSDTLRVLDERRSDLVTQHGRIRNQLHAVMRELQPGGIATYLDTELAAVTLRRIRPTTAADEIRRTIGLEMIGDLRRLQFQIDDLEVRIKTVLDECGSTLQTIHGVGPIMAGRILARTGDPYRFPTEAAFAAYTGTAPVEIASADQSRHRLSRFGDRTFNSAIHVVALSQARVPGDEGHAYYRRKLDEGKTAREAQRCLQRQVTKALWRTMRRDETRRLRASGRPPDGVPITAPG